MDIDTVVVLPQVPGSRLERRSHPTSNAGRRFRPARRPILTAMSSRSYRIVRIATVLLAVTAVTAAAQTASRSCGRVYDVTVAGLQHYADAEIERMTPATVIRHVDGDTFWVHIPCPPPGLTAEEKIRLMGLDTPEAGQPGAAEATAFVRRWIGRDPVYLAFDFRRRDRFDRLLAYVYLADGTLLNARLIECGHAAPYRDELNHFSALFEKLAAAPRPSDCSRDSIPAPMPCGAGAKGVVIAEIANGSQGREHLLLSNPTGAAVDVSGWRIRDDDGTHLQIPETEPLAANGGTFAICSGSGGCVGNPQPSLTMTRKNIWGNDGDAAVLCDACGTEVDSYCYKDGCSSAKPAPRCA